MYNSFIAFSVLILSSINFVHCSDDISVYRQKNSTLHPIDLECEISKTHRVLHDFIASVFIVEQTFLIRCNAAMIRILDLCNMVALHFPVTFVREIDVLSRSVIKMHVKFQSDVIFACVTLFDSLDDEDRMIYCIREIYAMISSVIKESFCIAADFGKMSFMASSWILWHPSFFIHTVVNFFIAYNLFTGNVPIKIYLVGSIIDSFEIMMSGPMKYFNAKRLVMCTWLIYRHRAFLIHTSRVALTRFLMVISLHGVTSRMFGFRLLYSMTIPVDLSRQWNSVACSFARNGYPVTVEDLKMEVNNNRIDLCSAMMEGLARSNERIDLDEKFIHSNKAILMRSAKLCNESIKIPKLEYFNLLNSEKTELFQLALAMNKRLGSLSPAKIITPFVIVSIAEALTNVRKQRQLVIHTK
jgi:hypothetical protein